LLVTQQCAIGVEHSFARRLRSIAAGLIGAILPGIEDIELGKSAELDSAIKLHPGAFGQ
jgi:hypothetical protein